MTPHDQAAAILRGADTAARLRAVPLDRLDAAVDDPADEPWEEPAPLSGGRVLPPFPVAALPGWVAEQVAGVAEFTQTPPDLAGCIALAALSTAAGGRAVVEVRGSWREPVNLYTVVVLPAGSRKSAVFAAMTGPLLAVERELVAHTRPRIVEAELTRAVAQRAAERSAAAAAKPGAGQPDALAEATDAALTADAIRVPALPRLVADDITAEATATLLSEQGGRLAVLSPEGGIFATLAGRYSGTPNLEVFLKGHAGDLLRVDRKGRAPEHIEAPALTLGLAVQPEVLAELADLPGFRGRGLLARILYALPENTVGRRRIGAPPVSSDVVDAYATNLSALVRTLADWTDPAVLPLTAAAGDAVLGLEADVEPRLAPGAEWSHIVDWGSKHVGAVVRLAGLIHLAEHLVDGWGLPVGADAVDRAAQLGRYFAAHALAAFDGMGTDPVVDDARFLLDWIGRHRPERFTRRELFSAVARGRFRKVGDLDPPLALLDQHGHLRRAPPPDRAGPGRPPSPTYLVHPCHWSAS